MLAQVLVRRWSDSVSCVHADDFARTPTGRDLFPSSDCLKAPQREHMLPREILTYAPDIACLQVGSKGVTLKRDSLR
jgi:hypothetical protein